MREIQLNRLFLEDANDFFYALGPQLRNNSILYEALYVRQQIYAKLFLT